MNKLLESIETDVGSDDEESLPINLVCDPDEYREEIAEFGLTKEQEDEFLNALWNIMSMMVDVGWGVDNIQTILPDIFEKAGQDSVNLVEVKDTRKSE